MLKKYDYGKWIKLRLGRTFVNSIWNQKSQGFLINLFLVKVFILFMHQASYDQNGKVEHLHTQQGHISLHNTNDFVQSHQRHTQIKIYQSASVDLKGECKLSASRHTTHIGFYWLFSQ